MIKIITLMMCICASMVQAETITGFTSYQCNPGCHTGCNRVANDVTLELPKHFEFENTTITFKCVDGKIQNSINGHVHETFGNGQCVDRVKCVWLTGCGAKYDSF
jgi:hypothetical protein